MKHKIRKITSFVALTGASSLASLSVLGAADNVALADALLTPKFFIAIFAGVVLALAFQLILTALSVALGVTAIGDVRERYVDAVVGVNNDDDDIREINDDFSSSPSIGVKVTAAFGIWSVITTCIALFCASLLAINLSVLASTEAAITIALVVWALFFIILFYLETRAASTILGGLIGAATAGLRSSANMVKKIFSPSEQKKVDKLIATGIDRVRKEFNASVDTRELSKTIDGFFKRVDRKIPDYNDLKKDITDIAGQSGGSNGTMKWMIVQQVLTQAITKNSANKDSKTQERVKQAQELLEHIKTEYQKGDSLIDGTKYAVAALSNSDKADIDRRLADFKVKLTEATPERFSKQQINDDISVIMDDPKMIATVVANKFEGVNRDSIIRLLDDNTNLEKDKLEGYADQVDERIQAIVAQFDKENDERLTKRVERSVASFFDGTERSELAYDELKNDVIAIYDDPRQSLAVVKARLKQLDGDSVRALLTNNRFIDDEQIDAVLDQVGSARNYLTDKIVAIEEETGRQAKMLRRRAVIQAEHTRKTAASAAWWLVITATVSALASVAGTMIA